MTELYIKPYGASAYSLVDLEANLPLPYTYNILDIRTPDKRDSHGSKTLVIPGTKANNILFEFIFEIGVDGGFNPNKKAEVYVLQDSIPVIPYGVLQLIKITRDKQSLDRIYYECVISSGLEDIFTALGESKLTDLDLSAYDHDYTAAVQATSWTASIGVGYVYPMIDYSGRTRSVSLANYDEWYVDEFLPAIYVKEYWDKMFALAGCTYTSAFLNTDFFKSLIIPCNKAKYQFLEADIIAREFQAELSAMQSLEVYPTQGTATVTLDNDSTGTAYDPSNIFNTTTHIATIQATKDGYYAFEIGGEIDFLVTVTGLATTTVGGSGSHTIGAGLVIIKNGTQVVKGVTNLQNVASGTVFTSGSTYMAENVQMRRDKIYLSAGDTITLELYTFYLIGFSLSGTATVTARLQSGAYLKCEFLNEFAEGMGLAVNSCIPENIKLKDFCKSIIQAMHLYIEVDPDDQNNYIIEPRDDYYTSDVVDWSTKLDYEKGIEIVPMADLHASKYTFKYKSDKDYYNESYQKKFSTKERQRVYGDKYIEIDNDFVEGEIVNELMFSATPSVGNDINTRVIPTMCFLNGDKPEHQDTNIRLLYWGGMKSYTGKAWVHKSRITGTYTAYATTYPYAGHLDDPFNPTLDLSFGMPAEVNWNIKRSNYTDGNLYNKYHRRFIEEITDPDSRMVTGYFLLTPVDIFNLSFRKLYFFEKELYRLNKITDYDLSEYKLVKCEFLKVKDPGVYSVSALPIYGGGDSVWDGDILPDVILPKRHNNNTYGLGNAVVLGSDNNVASTANGVIIMGVNNVVGDNAWSVMIQGNNNVVYPGVQNVALINTSDVTVTESDTTYINGCLVDGCVAIDGGGG